MKRLIIYFLILLVVEMYGCSVPKVEHTPPQGPANPPNKPFELAPLQTALRKLHLVRPDLIPYPLDLRYYA